MSGSIMDHGEQNLQTPERHPLDWKNPEFYDEASLSRELERVFEIERGFRLGVELFQNRQNLSDSNGGLCLINFYFFLLCHHPAVTFFELSSSYPPSYFRREKCISQ